MLNRYAKVDITRFEKHTDGGKIKQHYYVRIQRFGRTFPNNYGDCEDCWSDKDDGITLSSYQRLIHLVSYMYKHINDSSQFFNWTDVYEWQPNQKPFNEPTSILLEIAEDYETEELDDVKSGEDLENFIFDNDARSIDGDLADWCWSMVDWDYIYEQIRKS